MSELEEKINSIDSCLTSVQHKLEGIKGDLRNLEQDRKLILHASVEVITGSYYKIVSKDETLDAIKLIASCMPLADSVHFEQETKRLQDILGIASEESKQDSYECESYNVDMSGDDPVIANQPDELPDWQDLLTFDPNVSEHSPVVKGTWVTVSQIVTLIVDGYTWADILAQHPELTEQDIRVCLRYACSQEDQESDYPF